MAQPFSFEQSMAQLELLVDKLESGEVQLDSALEHYEQGIKLVRECQKVLKEAEQKVTMLGEQQDMPDA